jgi:hypothetical protein
MGRCAVVLLVVSVVLLAGCSRPATRAATHPDRSVGEVANGLRIDWSEAECNNPGRDQDRDGIDDGCENALATAFAPLLVVDSGECNWDDSVGDARLGGEYYYAVQRDSDTSRMRIAYLPAYYIDCGWAAPVCHITGWLCRPHTGDSELIIVQVRYDPARERWTTDGVFLSSHCYGRSSGNCRWYTGKDLEAFQWVDAYYLGAPVVWVASGKHANYVSKAQCDTGHWYYDSCDRNVVYQRFPIRSARQNIGSREYAFHDGRQTQCVGPTYAGWNSARTDPDAVECLWDPDRPFRGWQLRRVGSDPSPYGRYLREIAGF